MTNKFPWYGWILVLVLLWGVIYGVTKISASSPINLDTSSNFAVIAGSGIVDSNPSVIVGDAGSSPTTSNGLTAGEVTGTNYTSVSAEVDLAKTHLTDAYLAAEALGASTIPTELGGNTILAGVYETASGEFGITGTVTLDAEGDPDAIFIFQSGSTLITASDSVVELANGAQECNVFWQVTSSATLGTNSTFRGNILALASITDNGGSVVFGRLLAQTGAVTLNDTQVTKADCAIPIHTAPTTIIPPSSGGSSGQTKRCDTPTTPTCVEYFAPTKTPPAFVPSMPNTGEPKGKG